MNIQYHNISASQSQKLCEMAIARSTTAMPEEGRTLGNSHKALPITKLMKSGCPVNIEYTDIHKCLPITKLMKSGGTSVRVRLEGPFMWHKCQPITEVMKNDNYSVMGDQGEAQDGT